MIRDVCIHIHNRIRACKLYFSLFCIHNLRMGMAELRKLVVAAALRKLAVVGELHKLEVEVELHKLVVVGHILVHNLAEEEEHILELVLRNLALHILGLHNLVDNLT